MLPQEEIAETRIQEALAAGGFEKLPGAGEPLDLEGYFRTPAGWRMGMSVLRSAEIVPEELELLKEINRLEEKMAVAGTDEEREKLGMRLSEMRVVYDMKMERYRQRR